VLATEMGRDGVVDVRDLVLLEPEPGVGNRRSHAAVAGDAE
jgi:hypothetical protein